MPDPLSDTNIDGLSGPDGPAHWLAFAPDDKTLLIDSPDGVRWWDPAKGKLIRVFEGITAERIPQPSPAQFSPDGKTLVAHNGWVLLRWDVATGKPLFPEQDFGHGSHVSGVSISPDGKQVATQGRDNRVCVWDMATQKELYHKRAQFPEFSPDGKHLFVTDPDSAVVLKLDAATGNKLRQFEIDPKTPKQSGLSSIRLTSRGKTLIALTTPTALRSNGLVTTWDTTTGERKNTIEVPFLSGTLSPDGQIISRGGADPAGAGVFRVNSPELNLWKNAKPPGFGLTAGDFSDDGSWLVQIRQERIGGHTKYFAIIISTATWGVDRKIPLEGYGNAAFSSDGRTLAVAYPGKIVFINSMSGVPFGSHLVPEGVFGGKGLSGFPSSLCFTPDGTKLISGHADTTALVWPVPPRPAK